MGDDLEKDTKMEVRLDGFPQVRYGKIPVLPVVERTRLNGCFVKVCSSIVLWTVVFQLLVYGVLWHPHFLNNFSHKLYPVTAVLPSPPPPPPSEISFCLDYYLFVV